MRVFGLPASEFSQSIRQLNNFIVGAHDYGSQHKTTSSFGLTKRISRSYCSSNPKAGYKVSCPRKSADPNEKPQHERLKEAAREHGADGSGMAFGKAFGKIDRP